MKFIGSTVEDLMDFLVEDAKQEIEAGLRLEIPFPACDMSLVYRQIRQRPSDLKPVERENYHEP